MVGVRVSGAREAAAALERLADQAGRLDAYREVGEALEAELESSSPRLSGALAESWEVVGQAASIQVGSDLVYAPIQNYGSAYVTGSRFVERSAELVTDEAGRLISDEIDRLISRL